MAKEIKITETKTKIDLLKELVRQKKSVSAISKRLHISPKQVLRLVAHYKIEFKSPLVVNNSLRSNNIMFGKATPSENKKRRGKPGTRSGGPRKV